MLLYLTKITLILSVSIIAYKLFLEDTKVHVYKRFYLLITLIMALVFPFIIIESSIVSADQTFEQLGDIVIAPITQVTTMSINWTVILIVGYAIGVVVVASKSVLEIVKIYQIKSQGSLIKFNDSKIVLSSQISSAFSFCNIIYLPLSEELSEGNKILIHEQVHIRQGHSIDILLIELLKVVFWFHPLFYYYKTCIALNHEFLADSKSVDSEEDVNQYLQLLLTQTYKQSELGITSSFNFNLTKKRFLMMTKKNIPWKNRVGISMSCILFLLVSTLAIHAKTTNQKVTSDTANIPFQVTDTRAQYPGGMNKFTNDFVLKFIDPYPYSEEDEAKIVVQFTVEIDGTLENIKVLRDPLGVGQEIIKTLKSMPKWFPAQHNGEVVSTVFTLPITFKRTTQ
ncbi:M56 family metallopeptidase [Myroides sp. N17-2]|uniref:M56 family metallopeptidase n=1 Tax=Myroides sp. N17-2 TaxID=2030799 RepID=UPI000EFD04CF|nr:M56 family metallopeptidase [Myroides sp. N17-2]